MKRALEQRLDNNSASIPEQRSIEIYNRGAVELYTMPLGRLPPSESLIGQEHQLQYLKKNYF